MNRADLGLQSWAVAVPIGAGRIRSRLVKGPPEFRSRVTRSALVINAHVLSMRIRSPYHLP